MPLPLDNNRGGVAWQFEPHCLSAAKGARNASEGLQAWE